LTILKINCQKNPKYRNEWSRVVPSRPESGLVPENELSVGEEEAYAEHESVMEGR
jgi:hypothetical protein